MREIVRDGKESRAEVGAACPACGREVPAPAPLGLCPRCCLEQMMLGRMPGVGGIDDVEIVRVLGEGGFGTVYECLQLEPTVRALALKVLKGEVMSAGVRARFRDEMETLERLEHPNIARMVGAGETGEGVPYYLMELVEGVALDRWLAEAAPSPEERLEVAVQAAGAVAYAHGEGVVHRDLKPANVLVVAGGEGPVVKVIDFGMARVLEGPGVVGREVTRAEQFLGTPCFASPEQLGGGEVDERSDVFVLGLLLYLLVGERVVMGRLADGGMSWVERHDYVRDFVFPPMGEIAVGGNWRGRLREWDWVARRAAAFEPGERYGSAGLLLEDLRAMQSGGAVSGGRGYWDYRVRKFAVRHRSGLVVVGVCLLGLVGLFWGRHWAGEQSRRTEARVAASSERERLARVEAEALSRVQNSDVELAAGSLLMERGLYAEAREKLEGALRLSPENREARYALDVLLTTAAFAEEEVALAMPIEAREIVVVEGRDAVLVANGGGDVVLLGVGDEGVEELGRWDVGGGTEGGSLRASGEGWSVGLAGGGEFSAGFEEGVGSVGGEVTGVSPRGGELRVFGGDRWDVGVDAGGGLWRREAGGEGWSYLRDGVPLTAGGFDATGELFFAVAGKGVAEAFDVGTGEAVMAPLVFGGGRERGVFLSGRRDLVVVDGSDRLLRWDVSRAGRQYSEAVLGDPAIWLAFKGEGSGLTMTGAGGELWSWEERDGAPEGKGRLAGLGTEQAGMTPGEWEGVLSTAVQEFFVKWYFWRLVEEPEASMVSLEASLNREIGCAGTDRGSLTLFRSGGGVERVATLEGAVTETAISWDNEWAAGATREGEVVCFPVGEPGRAVRMTMDGGVHTMTVSDEPRRLVVGGMDGGVRLLGLEGGEGGRAGGALVVKHAAIAGGDEVVPVTVRTRPRSREFATVLPGDRRVKFWDVDTGEARGADLEHDGEIGLVVFSADGAFVFTVSHPGLEGGQSVVRVWSARTRREVTPPLLHAERILWATVVDGGRRIATSCDDGTVRWWEFLGE